MADETTDTTEEAPVADAPETTEEHPLADANLDTTEDTSVEPVAESDSPVVQEANIGAGPAQTFGPSNPPATSAPVEESFLTTDRVFTDHTDPLGTKYQFLGASAPAPLPIAGANGDVRTPEQQLASGA